MNKHIMLAGIALLGLPSLLAAQARVGVEGRAEVRRESTVDGGDAGTRANGHAAVRAALAAGLPEEPVRRVVAEGEAKGASAEAVDRAAASAFLRLQASREALRREEEGREPSRAEIVAGAEALAAGATSADLAVLRDAAPADRSLAASLHALAELRAAGTDGGTAAATIAARLAGGASDGAITALGTGAGIAAELGAGLRGTPGALDAGLGAEGVLRGGAGGGSVGGAVNGTVGGAVGGAAGGAVGGAVGIGASVVGAVGGGSR